MFLLLVAGLFTPATNQPLPLADSRFHYAVSPATASATRQLLIMPRKGKGPVQQVPLRGPAAQDPAQNIVVRDVDFDGQPDLMVTQARGNVNSQYAYWLYDAATQRFVLNEALGKAAAGYRVTFDSTKHQIHTAARFTCCEQQLRTYSFQNGHLKLLTTKTEKSK